MPNSTHIRSWSGIPSEKMNDLVSRQVLHGDTLTVARLELRRGASVPLHSHSNEQISMIASGALQFVVDGVDFVVRAGEMLQISGGIPHSALALEDTVAIDIFTPLREDWIRGDDAYLRGR